MHWHSNEVERRLTVGEVERGQIEGLIPHHRPVVVHLEQVTGGHLAPVRPVRVDQETVVSHCQRAVVVDALVQAVQGGHPEHRRQLHPFGPERRGGYVRPHGVWLIVPSGGRGHGAQGRADRCRCR